jgi:uncharacterized membrane protein YebE (DUF533 family)
METEKSENEKTESQTVNGHDSAPDEKKPIIDQMTDLAAQAAGALAETAVVAKKAKKAIAKRIPTSVKKARRR